MQINNMKINYFSNLNIENKWNKKIALILAKNEKIKMTKDHWLVIFFLRDFYLKYNIYPSMRFLIQQTTKFFKIKKSNSIYLFKLFPKGPLYQAIKIAGLPKNNKCL